MHLQQQFLSPLGKHTHTHTQIGAHISFNSFHKHTTKGISVLYLFRGILGATSK